MTSWKPVGELDPAYADTTDPGSIPFSVKRPLAFHVMTGAFSGPRGDEQLRGFLRDDVALLPAGDRYDAEQGRGG